MGKITKDELSSSLNDHIDNQGNDKQDEIDSNLQTSDKTIVGAINELYQNINDGKALIANTIGEPLTDEDSFTTMSNGIKSLTSLLKTNLANAGVDVNDEEKLKSLISKVKGIVKENTSKGIKFAEGTGSWTVSSSVTISSPDLDFTPDIIICHFESLTQTRYYYGNYTSENTTSYRTYITNDSPLINTYNSASKLYISDIELGSFKLIMDSVNENNSYGNYWYISGKCIGWYAIKLDEKDNTLRDLLASILEDEGVTVTEEDNMVSLITKTDEEFRENTNKLYDLMLNGGYEVNNSMNMDSLLEILKLKGLTGGEGNKGVQYASGIATPTSSKDFNGASEYYVEITNLTFKPSIILLGCTIENDGDYTTFYCEELASDRVTMAYTRRDSITAGAITEIIKSKYCTINSSGFLMPVELKKPFTWVAVGVGKEGNKGIQYASGNVSAESDSKNFNEPYGIMSSGRYVKIPKPPFEPNVLMVMGTATDSSTKAPFTPTSILSYDPAFKKSMVKVGSFGNGQNSQLYYDHIIADSLVVGSDYYYIPISYAYSQTGYDWFAFGAGEELSSFEEATFTMFSLNTNSYLSGSAWKNFANYTTTFNGTHTITLKYSIQSSDVNNYTLSSHPVTVEITHADTGEIETLTCPAATSSTQTFTHKFKARAGDNINIKSWGTVLYFTDTTITYTTLIKNK